MEDRLLARGLCCALLGSLACAAPVRAADTDDAHAGARRAAARAAAPAEAHRAPRRGSAPPAVSARPGPPRPQPRPRARDSAPQTAAAGARPAANARRGGAGLLGRAVRLGALLYLHYVYGYGDSLHGPSPVRYNHFRISRGYLNVRFAPTPWLEARITPDVHQAFDSGEWRFRLKYLYAGLRWPAQTVVVSDPGLRVGLVPTPWLHFAEQVNRYRAQGTLFSERQGLFESADLGLLATVLLGRRLPAAVAKRLEDPFPGTYGSLAVGLYNGTGYHDIEKNANKVVQARVTLRPLGRLFPNLQASYFFLWGHGNAAEENAPPLPWWHHQAMLSFVHPALVLTGQVIAGRGTQAGADSAVWLDADGRPRRYWGASGFAEVRWRRIRVSCFARYDYFKGPNPGGTAPYHRLIAGLVYHLWGWHRTLVMLDGDYALMEGAADPWSVKLTLQVAL